MLLIHSCGLFPEQWRDDYSTMSCEVTWPNKELDKVIFHSSYDKYKGSSPNGSLYDNYFRYYKYLNSTDEIYWILRLVIRIDLFDSTVTKTPTLDHKYKITSPNLNITDRNGYIMEDIKFVDGYVMFTKYEKYLGYIRLSGEFEIICDKLTITNGTFIDILCEDNLGKTLEHDEDIVNTITIDFE